MHVDTQARRAGGDRSNEHIPGAAGVLAHDQCIPGLHQAMRGGAAEGVGERWPEIHVRDATDSIGAEEASHVSRGQPRESSRARVTRTPWSLTTEAFKAWR